MLCCLDSLEEQGLVAALFMRLEKELRDTYDGEGKRGGEPI